MACRVRLALQERLAEEGLTAVAWALRLGLDLCVIERLLQGEYPPDPVALHAIGAALGAEPEAWAELTASGICRWRPEGSEGLEGDMRKRWWRQLILSGVSADAVAFELGLSRSARQHFLSSGILSPALRQGRLPRWLGLDDATLATLPQRAGSPALGERIHEAMRCLRWRVTTLARALGISVRTLQRLRAGHAPRSLRPQVVPRLAERLQLDLGSLSTLLAQARQRRHVSAPDLHVAPVDPTLASELLRHCYARGEPPSQLAQRLGISAHQVRRVLDGRLVHPRVLHALSQELRLPAAQWELATRMQRARRLTPGGPPGVASLRELIQQAIQAHGGDGLRWALAHGLSAQALTRIQEHGAVPRRIEVRRRLILALGIDRPTFDAAAKRLLEAPPVRRLAEAGCARTPLQEHFLRQLNTAGTSVRALARDSGVGCRTIEKIVRHGSCELRLAVREKLRSALGLDQAAFAAAMRAYDSDAALSDDDELRLLALFRRLGPQQQRMLVATGQNLRAHDAR
jgi:transcriptional regulator with XRE-family HTH domain